MSSPIIEVTSLSKAYRLGQIGSTTLKEELQQLWRRIKKQDLDHDEDEKDQSNNDLFWALKDVSFGVESGNVLGIIGKNGAGKSTLLKILSRITEPTRGEAKMRGRVASLLEVGTGFHPDLTGRENIYLNGAFLGMSKQEINSKFDEIVDFSGVEKFIDTPVKRYSSGMYVRLAFAVAAHLEPEILIVDEVLAVGDASFQKKCLGKMHEVSSNQGRTVLFVSHNMNAVEFICNQCVHLDNGSIRDYSEDVGAVIRQYLLASSSDSITTEWVNTKDEWDNDWFTLERFTLNDADGQMLSLPIRNDSDVWVCIEGTVKKVHSGLQLGFGIFHASGPMLFWSTNRDCPEIEWQELAPGKCILRNRIPARFLNEGEYRLDLFLGIYHQQWICEPGVNGPSIYLDIKGGLSDSPYWVEARPGLLGPVTSWQVQTG